MAAKFGKGMTCPLRLALTLFVANVAWTQQYSISTLAGRASERQAYSGDGGLAINAHLSQPSGLAADSAGNVFVADYVNCRIRKILPNGIILTVAGNGNSLGNIGDGGAATKAQLWTPKAVAVDGAGNIFVADASNHRIRKVSSNGIISTVAGIGSLGYSGDGGPATEAQLVGPSAIAVDGTGNLFIADSSNNRVRKVSSRGTITTLAGNGAFGYSGDGGPATRAVLASPEGVAVDGAGNTFVADNGNNRIRKISPNGLITNVAGTGAEGFSGDGGPATSAALNSPFGVAVDSRGNVFVADSHNNRIRKISPDGTIQTIAGSGPNGTRGNFSGDGGPAVNAHLNGPRAVAVDNGGNVYIADYGNDVIRVLRPASQ